MTDREKAIEILTNVKNTPQITWTNGADVAFDIAIKALEERPTGRWKVNNFGEHVCPLCGHYALYEEEPDDYYEVQSNFCPNCGADMRGNE